MICQNCHKNSATIHLTEIVNGQRHEKHLCEDCAQASGVHISAQIPLNELLNSLLSADAKEQMEQQDTGIECPSCHTNMESIQKDSLLGCPNDYDIFGQELEKIIEKTQDGGKVHCGKKPSRVPKEDLAESELLILKRKLDEAVRHEEYETAAIMRDKIKELECD